MREEGVAVRGFVTHEIREQRRRVGFEVESFEGGGATLAHVQFSGPPRVGKYGVDVEAFERLAIPTLRKPPAASVVVIDELGKMELASDAFCDAVSSLFEGPAPIVATVHVFRHPFTDALKRRPDVERVQVTHANRSNLAEQIARRLAEGVT